MIARHALWSGLASGRGYSADTPEKRLALARWNLVIIAERFGWTLEYTASLPQDVLEDTIAILNVRDHYANSHSSDVRKGSS